MSDKSINANWTYPTNLWVGAGRIKELAQACRSSGFCKPLFVTDAGIVNLPITELALNNLKKAGIECNVFSDVKPNPTGANVEAGIKIFQEGGHDGVIAFGGGSALDAAKAIALMGKQSRPLGTLKILAKTGNEQRRRVLLQSLRFQLRQEQDLRWVVLR